MLFILSFGSDEGSCLPTFKGQALHGAENLAAEIGKILFKGTDELFDLIALAARIGGAGIFNDGQLQSLRNGGDLVLGYVRGA